MTISELTPDTAVFLLVDHQTGVVDRIVKAPTREEVEANVLRLARGAAVLGIPTVFTTSEEAGINGPLFPALEAVLPDEYAHRIDRHGVIDSMADPTIVAAREASGRRRLVTAGIGTEVCGIAPALHARREGYEVTFVADACGSATAFGHDISLRRLESNGVQLTTTAAVLSELSGRYPTFEQIMRG
jgi:nicotinamidase-related amidase